MSAVAPGRRIPAETFWRTARASLARLACEYADPTGTTHPHNHSACLLDDESLTADLLLRLAATVTAGDESAMLDVLEFINTTMKRDTL